MKEEFNKKMEEIAKNGGVYLIYESDEEARIRINNEKIERWMMKQYLLGNTVNNLFNSIPDILPCDTSGDMKTYYYSEYQKYINEKYK